MREIMERRELKKDTPSKVEIEGNVLKLIKTICKMIYSYN